VNVEEQVWLPQSLFLSFGVSDLIIAAEVTKEIKFTETNTPTSHPQEE
jgi:hypothetical protein